jgi:uncharacterized circularly permuted ATP-grasp superfamily protein/uncharacterized alpha-E superfamily protein
MAEPLSLSEYPSNQTFFNETGIGKLQGLGTPLDIVISGLKEIGAVELENRANSIHRLLKENGVAYNIYTDPSGGSRAWKLDPIPQLITAPEWKVINTGLIQRAKLFNLMLQDIYGPQHLIKEGLIPQELIYLHPGFLRSCVNIHLPLQQHLIVYAADLGRGSDGQLWIISDRTQAPSGYGYALENRLAMTSVLPELFRDLNVSRLTSYFDTLRYTLNNLAPHASSHTPRVVILTPGPENETYFEHSYLAAYLGLTLVEGDDLMVKDNFVWLKTIEGLEKVDVILRRMDDAYCDPLELKSDSLLGIPGLLQVVRKQHVAIANPLGSSVIENSALMPFLHLAAKRLLGEDLILPSIATWWCGQPKEMQYVIEHIPQLVIRRIYRRRAGTRSAIDGASLSEAKRAELIREIKANPHLFAGQEKIGFSATPSWVDGQVRAGHSLIRSFLVQQDESFKVMPGGLTRTSFVKDSFIISNQTGGISKDTWVISDEIEEKQPAKFQHITSHAMLSLQRDSLPSHTAENLFWVGRYTERLINNARLLRTVMEYLSENNKQTENQSLFQIKKILLQTLTHCTYSYPGFILPEDPKKEEELLRNPWHELKLHLYDEGHQGGLSQNLQFFKKAVYQVRNFLSPDTWHIVRQLDEVWSDVEQTSQNNRMLMIEDIDKLNTFMFSILGMNRESARREQQWAILDLGRKFEQVLFIIRSLQNFFAKKTDDRTEYELMQSLLTATQSIVTYRYTFRDHLQLPLLLELLVLDMNYPKSLAYLIEKIKLHILAMPKAGNVESANEASRLIQEASQLLTWSDSITLSRFDNYKYEYQALRKLLTQLNHMMLEIHLIISKTYFKHTQSQQQLFVSNMI